MKVCEVCNVEDHIFDCPVRIEGLVERVKLLEDEVIYFYETSKEWQRLANEWMADYDKLKAKYEPVVASLSDGI